MNDRAPFIRLRPNIGPVFAMALGGCVFVGAAGCGKKPASAPDVGESESLKPVTVTVAPAAMRRVERVIDVVGTLHGFEVVTITPKVEGRVRSMRFEIGDRVAAGSELMTLEDEDYRLAVAEANRAVELEEARLGATSTPDEAFDIESLPSVSRASLLVENSRRRLARQKSLLDRQASTEDAYDQAETDLRVASETLSQARLEAKTILATIRHRQAVLALAEQKLSESHVSAPAFDPGPEWGGESPTYVVSRRFVSQGEMVRSFPSTPVYELVLDGLLKFQATVPERYAGAIEKGQSVTLRVDAYPDEVFSGRITRANPTVDPESRAFEIEALVRNADHRLRHGGFAKGGIVVRADDQAIAAPLEAIVTFAGVTKVFRARDGLAEEVEVELGVQGTDWVELIGPIKAGDSLVTSGQTKLAEGTPLEIRATSESAEPLALSRK